MADEYANGAQGNHHAVQRIEVASMEFPLLRTKEEFERGLPPEPIRAAQESIRWADHLLIVYPLWHGTMPALLKGFFEQVFRPGFALAYQPSRMPKKLLTGKSARIVVTMGMPAFVYRWYFHAYGLKSLERSILGFAGVAPIKDTLIGMMDGMNETQRAAWLEKMRRLGGSSK